MKRGGWTIRKCVVICIVSYLWTMVVFGQGENKLLLSGMTPCVGLESILVIWRIGVMRRNALFYSIIICFYYL